MKYNHVYLSARLGGVLEILSTFLIPALGMNHFQTSSAPPRSDGCLVGFAAPSVADMISPRMGAGEVGQCRLEVMASTSVTQQQLWQLFDIVPGLEICDFDPFTGE